MRKESLLEEVCEVLDSASCSFSLPVRGCFDLVSRFRDKYLVIKVLTNIDSLDAISSGEMQRFSDFVSGSPLLIGERTTKEPLMDHVVYRRHSIPSVNLNTFECVINDDDLSEMIIFHEKGGFYVNIDSEKVKRARKEENLSIHRLSVITGISSRTLLGYETEGRASLEKAKCLEETLGDVTKEIDIFELTKSINAPEAVLESDVSLILSELGFYSSDIRRAPFNICAKDPDTKYIVKMRKITPQQTEILKSICAPIEGLSFVISDRRERSDLPIITKKELKGIKHKNELKNMVYGGG